MSEIYIYFVVMGVIIKTKFGYHQSPQWANERGVTPIFVVKCYCGGLLNYMKRSAVDNNKI